MSILSDIQYEIQHLNRSRTALRNFSLALGILMLCLSGLAWWKSNGIWPVWAVVGCAMIMMAFVTPLLIKPVYLVIASVAAVVGYFLSRIILMLIFLCLVTPISVVMRILGKDPMHRRIDKHRPSYWIQRTKKSETEADYEKLF